jgi:hypothetical protein
MIMMLLQLTLRKRELQHAIQLLRILLRTVLVHSKQVSKRCICCTFNSHMSTTVSNMLRLHAFVSCIQLYYMLEISLIKCPI